MVNNVDLQLSLKNIHSKSDYFERVERFAINLQAIKQMKCFLTRK